MFFCAQKGDAAGIFFSLWIITMFGMSLSGAHFNPAITLAQMLRKNSTFGQRRLLGVIYIVGQICGGMIAGLAYEIVCSETKCYAFHPNESGDSQADDPKYQTFASILSEICGTFVYVLFFIISTEKHL